MAQSHRESSAITTMREYSQSTWRERLSTATAERITRLAVNTCEAQNALLALIFHKKLEPVGKNEHLSPALQTWALEQCHIVVTNQALLVINEPMVDAPPITFAGVPLTMNGGVVGVLCILDSIRRTFTDNNLEVLNDLAALVVAELEQHEQASRYQMVVEQGHDLIGLLDEDGHYLYASPAYQLITGRDATELIGTSVFDLIHPHDRDGFVDAWRAQLLRNGSAQILFRYPHASGAWRWYEANGTRTNATSQSIITLVSRDITERKRLEGELLHAQRMESISQLAGGVAHDFNNVLAGILGYADLVQASLPADTLVRTDLEEIRKAARRAASLTKQLLAFARRQIIAPRVLNLNELLEDNRNVLQQVIGDKIDLVFAPMEDLWHVTADPAQIEQVLINLAANARDAMPDAGTLLIETQNTVLDSEYAREHLGSGPGQYVLLAITDTGVGLTDEARQHMFEPFFTTKEPGKGTGLGLAMCYGIVKQHGGNIWVYSELGNGTTVKMYLPRADTAETIKEVDQSTKQYSQFGSETVLVVEDDDSIRDLTARVLRAYGYVVLEANDGAIALELVRAYSGKIDLLLTDVVMPQMGGRALADHLTAQRPGLRVLFTSGYTDRAMALQGQPLPNTLLLLKPAAPANILRMVRLALDT